MRYAPGRILAVEGLSSAEEGSGEGVVTEMAVEGGAAPSICREAEVGAEGFWPISGV